MKVRVNGREEDLTEGITVAGLLLHMNLPADRVAVELNREIAKRSCWSVTVLKEGDILEVVTFVGGG